MVRGRRGGGEVREARIFGFETRDAERRLRSRITSTQGSNNKKLAVLPASPPPCDSRRYSRRAISTAAARGVPFRETKSRHVSFCEVGCGSAALAGRDRFGP